MQTNSTEKASPLYLNESYTERSSSQKGHRNSNRNSTKKSAVITTAHSKRNFTYSSVLLPICSAILFLLMGRRILPQSAFRLFIIRGSFRCWPPWCFRFQAGFPTNTKTTTTTTTPKGSCCRGHQAVQCPCSRFLREGHNPLLSKWGKIRRKTIFLVFAFRFSRVKFRTTLLLLCVEVEVFLCYLLFLASTHSRLQIPSGLLTSWLVGRILALRSKILFLFFGQEKHSHCQNNFSFRRCPRGCPQGNPFSVAWTFYPFL